MKAWYDLLWTERYRAIVVETQEQKKLHAEIEALLRRHASAPLFGLAGVELVNVVEVNLALHRAYGPSARKGR